MRGADCIKDYGRRGGGRIVSVPVRGADCILKSSHADNHYLDCEVYAAAAADVLEVRSLFLKNPDRAEEQAPKPAPPKPQPAPEENWIQQNENWF